MALFRAAANTHNTSTNSNTVTKPTGTLDGDVMVAIVYINDSTATITPPANWTLIDTINTTISGKMSTYYKVASSEGANYQWDFSVTNRNSAAIASFYQGLRGTIDAHGVQANGAGTNAIAPSITPTVTNSTLVFLCCQDTTATSTYTPPTGMTEVLDTGGVSAIEIAYSFQESAVATGTKTAVPTDTTDQNAAFLVALVPKSNGMIAFF